MTGAILPAPGWYHDGRAVRWWDGHQWGPYAPAVDPIASGRTMAVLVHLGIFLGGFVLPLVLRLTEGEKNDYVRHHSTEALNMNLTMLVAMFALYPLAFVSLLVASGHAWAFVLVVSLWGLFGVAYLVAVIFSILGAVRASQGRWWRYPVAIRFVRGAAPHDGRV